MPDVGKLIATPGDYFMLKYRLVARTLLIEVATACLIAVAVYAIPRANRVPRSSSQDALWHVFHSSSGGTKKATMPIVELRTTSGKVYKGTVVARDQTGPTDERMLVLARPYRVQRADGSMQRADAHWERVVLPLSTVEEMYVAFVPRGKPHGRRVGKRRISQGDPASGVPAARAVNLSGGGRAG